mmetsp:Transcript_926/g.1724  ORF Transcript_926/g.1724 Transcript_926/m.1724 type:complete len:325 (-) Transcript_926:624-1598(-)
MELVIPPVGYIKGLYHGRQVTDTPQVYYDLDLLANSPAPVRIRHFASSCQCFDAVILPESARSLDPKEVENKYRYVYPSKYYQNTSQQYMNDRPNVSIWNLTLDSIQHSPSACNHLQTRCVFLPFNALQKFKMRTQFDSCVSRVSGTMQAALQPSAFLMDLAMGFLPAGFKPESTLLVHLRYFAGEYGRDPVNCQSGEYICLGRGHIPSKVPVQHFVETIRAFANESQCDSIFTILPHFASDKVHESLCNELGFNSSMLVSHRGLPPPTVLLIERAIAIGVKEFISETYGTSFSHTINIQRRARGKSQVHSIERLLWNQNSTRW